MLRKLKALMVGAVCLSLLMYVVLLAAGGIASGKPADTGTHLKPLSLEGEYSARAAARGSPLTVR